MSRTAADNIVTAIDRRISTLVRSMWESLDGCSYEHRYTKRHAETAATGLMCDVYEILGPDEESS